MRQITLNYQARGFKVVSAFGVGEFEYLMDWMRGEGHVNLNICTVDAHVPRAENETTKRLTIEITRRVTVLINSFRKAPGMSTIMTFLSSNASITHEPMSEYKDTVGELDSSLVM